jgi:hypothetical protein
MIMRKSITALALAASAAVPSIASAQLSGNMGIFSEYRFRGIAQTFKQPAIQGGIDYGHASGFYIGNWNSNVSGLSYANGGGIEMDVYGGFKKGFGDVTLDVGLLQYLYPGSKYNNSEKYDTTEAYIGASWKWLSAKYSITTGDYFGVNSTTFGGLSNRDGSQTLAAAPGDSKGSGYLDVSASYEIAPKLTLAGHFGMQTIKNYGPLEYNDYKIGLTYDMSGWLLGAAYISTDADEKWYFLTNGTGTTKETGKGTLVLSVAKTF